MIQNYNELLLSIIIIAVIGVASFKTNILSRSGLIAATLVGCPILIFGGIKWFIILLSFLITSAFFTRFKFEKKLKLDSAEAKGGARGWRNVFSNGFIASISAIFYGMTLQSIFGAAFLGAMASSIADTLATEVGLLSRSKPRLITNPHVKVQAGTSGGITFLGEVAGLFGSLELVLIGFFINFEDFSIFQLLIFNLVGLLASNFDSLVGATVQAVYKCSVCGKITEKKFHCEMPTEHYKGIKFIDNNFVNFVSTIFGAAVNILLHKVIAS